MEKDSVASAKVIDYIRRAIPGTLKRPEGCLKLPYIIPGGPYARDLWDWDSYWTLYAVCGLYRCLGATEELAKLKEYGRGTLYNFLERQGADGSLPILISVESDDYFDCLHHPDNNMAKPFIGQLAKLLLECGIMSQEEIAGCLDKLANFHQCYDDRYLDERTGLVVWAKDWGIGMDDDPTAWGRPPKSCGSVFLNTFLLKDCQALRDLAQICGNDQLLKKCNARIDRLSRGLETYCWDSREKAYFSVDVQCHQQLAKLPLLVLNVNLDAFWHCLKLKVQTWYTFLPFWAGLGTQEQLDSWLRENYVSERLRSPFGLRTLSADEPMYQPEIARGNPSNWLGPIWLLPNFLLWETLNARGYRQEAEKLAADVVGLLARDLDACGDFHEYYSPETGLGVSNAGFLSWNALAAILAR